MRRDWIGAVVFGLCGLCSFAWWVVVAFGLAAHDQPGWAIWPLNASFLFFGDRAIESWEGRR